MQADGTATMHSFPVEPTATDQRPGLVRKVMDSLGIST